MTLHLGTKLFPVNNLYFTISAGMLNVDMLNVLNIQVKLSLSSYEDVNNFFKYIY